MCGRQPEHVVRHPLLVMRWDTVSFLHWAYDPADVAALVPKGLELELFDGRAWVGLVSFVMAGVRPPLASAVPGISFPEINVRTYVRRPDGKDGLLFLTLEAQQPLTVVARPSIGIAYAWAEMSVLAGTDAVTYTTRRRWPAAPAAASRHVVGVGPVLKDRERTDFDDWLTGRWRAYSRRAGTLLCTPVEHEPWPLHRAELLDIDDGLIASCGLPAPSGEPVVHYSPGVNVRLGVPRPLR